MSDFPDPASNFHPYECDGRGKCVHCDRSRLFDHDPSRCALCDPAYDMQPNPYWPRPDIAPPAQVDA